MSTEGPVRAALQKAVDAREFAGAATLAWRNGNVQTTCVGWRDREGDLPVERDNESGGTGLWSTVDDYLRLVPLRAWRGGGWRAAPASRNAGNDGQQPAHGRPARCQLPIAREQTLRGRAGVWAGCLGGAGDRQSDWMREGNPGTVSWPGACGAWWQADPKDGSVLNLLATSVADMHQMSKGIGLGVWTAIGTFQRLAS